MDMTGERRIAAPRERVWDALQDPDVLRRAIPGCTTCERTAETAFEATAAVNVGPIATRFTGELKLLDVDAPAFCRIQGSGQGGSAGLAKGSATVTLAEDGGFTLLSYTVNAEVGGKLAQLGGRLIESSARQMADQFFDNFTAAVAGPVASAADGAAGLVETLVHPASVAATGHGDAPGPIGVPREPLGFPLVAWIGGAAWLVIFIMLFSAYL